MNLSHLKGKEMIMKVKELLDKNGHDFYSVSPDTTAFDALQLMAEKKIDSVVVLDEEKLVGITHGYKLKTRYARLRATGKLRVEEVANLIGKTVATVRSWGKKGIIKTYPYSNHPGVYTVMIARICACIAIDHEFNIVSII